MLRITQTLSGALARLLSYKLIVILALIAIAAPAGRSAAALAMAPGQQSGDFRAPAIGATALPSVSIVAADPAAGEAGPDAASFTVTRGGDTTAPLKVAYAVAGTATAGKDYAPLPGSVTIPAGATSATFALRPIDDQEVKAPRPCS
jgi:hypothetical protein